MLEDFLHFIWRTRRFDFRNLTTTQGEITNIHKFGHLNTHAGPDFLEAKIQIGDTLWAGNVEMHLSSSDWYKHKHQNDPAYDNVILHVVYNHDREVLRKNGELIPCLVLKNIISEDIKHRYKYLIANRSVIACRNEINSVPSLVKMALLDKLLIERLESKTLVLQNELAKCDNDWNMICYQSLSSSFGLKVNKEAFEMLARSLDFKILQKHRNNLFQIEALLFGQAGILSKDFNDEYFVDLKREYIFLKTKYKLSSIPVASWKYMRMRPANFPTIRIAQFAKLLHQTEHMFSRILMAENTREIYNLLKVEISGYWKNHYTFDKLSKSTNKKMGRTFLDLVVINSIVPLLFVYSRYKDEAKYFDKAIGFLQEMKPEKNSILSKWDALGLPAKQAADSQALIELYKNYCNKKKCASCSIGVSLLKSYSKV